MSGYTNTIQETRAPINGTDEATIDTLWYDATAGGIYKLVDDINFIWRYEGAAAGGSGAGSEVDVTKIGGIEVAAHDAADTGNPLKVGGKYNLTQVAVDDGDRTDLQTDEYGNVRIQGVDTTLGLIKTSSQTPDRAQDTSPVDALGGTPYELTDSFTDVAGELDCRQKAYLTLYFSIDIGTSTDVQIRILFKHTSAGDEEYREIYLGTPAANLTTINLNDYDVATDADQLFKLTIPVTGVNFVQVQAKDSANGTGQIDSLYYITSVI